MKKVIVQFIILSFGLILFSACSANQNEQEQIIYLDYDPNQIAQIFTQHIGGDAKQLTNSETDILEYTLSIDGSQIAFVVKEGNGGNSIWVLDRDGQSPEKVRNCPTSICNHLAWHPDGQRLLYEKRPFSAQTRPTIWWVDVTTGETTTVLSDPNEISSSAVVSPDGQWLSYFSLPTESIQFVHLATGKRFSVPSTIDSQTVWHPDRQEAIIRDINVVTYHTDEGDDHTTHDHDFSESLHLFKTDVQTQSRHLLDETGNADDGNAAWSPDGEWVAFGRKISRTNTGRQLWLMRGDGSEAHALTDDLQIQHGPSHWSENGRYLLYQKANLADADPQPTIWRYDLETNQAEQLTNSGWFPNWLP